MKVSVLGSGSFGTALASVLADKGEDVLLWARNPEIVESVNQAQENVRYLPGMKLPEKLKATSDIQESLSGAELIVVAIPSQAPGGVLRDIASDLPAGVPLVSAAKGIEKGTLRLVSEIFEEELPGKFHKQLTYLSGPSFAKEIVRKIPTVVSIAAKDDEVGHHVQHCFFHKYFRTYRTQDVIGVEVGGALKNVIAIAAGVSDGLELGHNTRAAIITRGLAEISRLGVAKGADPMTFLGLAGMGDLVLTCTGDLSRNRTVGKKLGEGMKLKDIIAEMNQVAEGIDTTASAHDLAKKLGLELAITDAVFAMLYKDMEPAGVARELMSRGLKKEMPDENRGRRKSDRR